MTNRVKYKRLRIVKSQEQRARGKRKKRSIKDKLRKWWAANRLRMKKKMPTVRSFLFEKFSSSWKSITNVARFEFDAVLLSCFLFAMVMIVIQHGCDSRTVIIVFFGDRLHKIRISRDDVICNRQEEWTEWKKIWHRNKRCLTSGDKKEPRCRESERVRVRVCVFARETGRETKTSLM